MMLLGMWKVFSKADRKPWLAIVPLYNNWVLFEIAGRPGWWSLASLLPVVGWVAWIMMSLDLARRFKKGRGFTVLIVLLPPVALCILGYGDAAYKREPTVRHAE